MNKSMRNAEKRAFSLAEALITLLIVCLITLASIPILTKKKRDVNNGGHGKWLCTINSAGQYVYWDSETKVGDVNNPDTWSLNADQTKCTFVPKPGKKNYTVTLIGGGSAGGDGSSERKMYLNEYNNIYTPLTSGDYRLAVIGAGGGGSGSKHHDGRYEGVGGQGGGGAAWIGTVRLQAGTTYFSTVSSGADGIKGSGARQTANDLNDQFSEFKVGGVPVIRAGRGEGGMSTVNHGGKKPARGDGGEGGDIETNDSLLGSLGPRPVVVIKGAPGQTIRWCDSSTANGCEKELTPTYHNNDSDNGVIIHKNFWGATSSEYGRGGYGTSRWPTTERQGGKGGNGAVLLWQIKKEIGAGGEASPLAIYSFPEIKSKIDFVIGRGGQLCSGCNKNGTQSTGTLYDSGNRIQRVLKSQFGKYPESNTTAYSGSGNVSGGNGQASLWNGKYGGSGGSCSSGHTNITYINKTIKTYRKDSNGNPICRIKLCKIGVYKQGNLNALHEGAAKKCPFSETTNPQGACIGFNEPPMLDSDTPTRLQNNQTIYEKFLNDIELEDNMNNTITLDDVKRRNQTLFISSSTIMSPAVYNYISRSFVNVSSMDSLCECYAYAFEQKTSSIPQYSYVDEPNCNDAGGAKFFGAGGGGGGASDTIGVAGKGGNGGNGAAIVEW